MSTINTPEILPPKRSKDVKIYRRHADDCTQSDDCSCPLWLYIKATQKRVSARTTSWSAAEIEQKKIIASFDPVQREITELRRKRQYESVLLSVAVTKYIECKRSEGVAESTLGDYTSSVGQMVKFMHNRGIAELREITHEVMNDWKAEQWKTVKRSGSRKKVRNQIRMLFNFCCINQRWMDRNDNPADALLISKTKNRKQKQEEVVPAVPFYDDQYRAILDAATRYDQKPRTGRKRICTAQRLHALIQLMRWSGLAIRDAVNVQRSRIDKDGVLTLRRAKTFEPVTVPLPLEVIEELNALPVVSDGFFYDNDLSENARSRTACYSTAFLQLFPVVSWPRPVQDGDGNPVRPHPHMFRHTFAYWWLVTKRQAMRDLQILLGHSSIKTTESNYAQIMGDAVRELNDRVRLALGESAEEGKKKEPESAPLPPHQPEHHFRVRHAARRSTMSR